MKNNKPVVVLAGAIAALFVISFVIRFVALSELGLPGGWTLFFGLPVGGIGLLILFCDSGCSTSAKSRPPQFGPFSTTLSPPPR